MIIRKHFLNILRWGLRFHGMSHFIEVISALNEEAYITASIALIFICIDNFHFNFDLKELLQPYQYYFGLFYLLIFMFQKMVICQLQMLGLLEL